MKKLLSLLLLLFLTTSVTPIQSDVYICGPRGAKRYHFTKDCRGLSNCKHGLYKTTLKEARGYGLTLCGWED